MKNWRLNLGFLRAQRQMSSFSAIATHCAKIQSHKGDPPWKPVRFRGNRRLWIFWSNESHSKRSCPPVVVRDVTSGITLHWNRSRFRFYLDWLMKRGRDTTINSDNIFSRVLFLLWEGKPDGWPKGEEQGRYTRKEKSTNRLTCGREGAKADFLFKTLGFFHVFYHIFWTKWPKLVCKRAKEWSDNVPLTYEVTLVFGNFCQILNESLKTNLV